MFNRTIKTKIAVVTLTVSVISVLIISIVFYSIYKRSIIQSTIDINNQSTLYLSDYLNDYLKNLNLTAVELYNESEPIKISILDIVKNGYTNNVSDYYTERQIVNKYFAFIQNQRKSIVKTVIISDNQTIVDTWNRNHIYTKINLNPIIRKYLMNNHDDSLFSSYKATEINKQLLVYKKVIYDLFTHEKIATLLYFIDYDNFEWEKYNLQNNTIMVVNPYDEIIYHSNKNERAKKASADLIHLYSNNSMGHSLEHNNDQLIHYINLDKHLDLKLINITTLNELKKE